MVCLLAKKIIKNHSDYENADVRRKYGILCGSAGVFFNFLLFVFKAIFGFITSSVSMISDAFNNLSDAASSIVEILGFKFASKQADKDHPFGHGRLEYISGLVISFLILLMGFELFKSSISALCNPSVLEFHLPSFIVMIAAVLVKFYMYKYNHSIAKKINSVAIEAAAKDSLSDMISMAVVIAALLLDSKIPFPVDETAGIIVSVFILKNGIEAARETIDPIMGKPVSQKFVNEIERIVMSHEPICGIHDVVVHDYGPSNKMVSLHAEVPGDEDIFKIHDVIDNAEWDIQHQLGCVAVIHMDPVDLNNTKLTELKHFLKEKLPQIDPNLTFHDVRMVPGQTHTNLIFDVLKPKSCFLSDSELSDAVTKLVQNDYPDVFCVINVDQNFVEEM